MMNTYLLFNPVYLEEVTLRDECCGDVDRHHHELGVEQNHAGPGCGDTMQEHPLMVLLLLRPVGDDLSDEGGAQGRVVRQAEVAVWVVLPELPFIALLSYEEVCAPASVPVI
jgi:hypothetical protein